MFHSSSILQCVYGSGRRDRRTGEEAESSDLCSCYYTILSGQRREREKGGRGEVPSHRRSSWRRRRRPSLPLSSFPPLSWGAHASREGRRGIRQRIAKSHKPLGGYTLEIIKLYLSFFFELFVESLAGPPVGGDSSPSPPPPQTSLPPPSVLSSSSSVPPSLLQCSSFLRPIDYCCCI